MNILLVINTPGGSKDENTVALVPAEKLAGIDLDLIDRFIVQVDEKETDHDQEVADKSITDLYKRLGLEPQSGWEENPDPTSKVKVAVEILPTDLAEYLNPEMPIGEIERVVQIGWAY